jgi:hypothetical protein
MMVLKFAKNAIIVANLAQDNLLLSAPHVTRYQIIAQIIQAHWVLVHVKEGKKVN